MGRKKCSQVGPEDVLSDRIPKAPIYFMPTCGRVWKEQRAGAGVAGWRGGAQGTPAERAAGRAQSPGAAQ